MGTPVCEKCVLFLPQGWFSDGTLPAAALPRANFSLYSHGVNNAMAVKWGAVWGAEFGSQSARQASLKAWTLLQRDHGTASGAFGADEHLAGARKTKPGQFHSCLMSTASALYLKTKVSGYSQVYEQLLWQSSASCP
eukprot:905177-Amphidinium_carterae.1